jgi:alpha-L-rhamnosidase
MAWTKASINTLRGVVSSAWKKRNNTLQLNITIPANSYATVYVPAGDTSQVTEGGISVKDAEGVEFLRMENGCAVLKTGSGKYSFESSLQK